MKIRNFQFAILSGLQFKLDPAGLEDRIIEFAIRADPRANLQVRDLNKNSCFIGSWEASSPPTDSVWLSLQSRSPGTGQTPWLSSSLRYNYSKLSQK